MGRTPSRCQAAEASGAIAGLDSSAIDAYPPATAVAACGREVGVLLDAGAQHPGRTGREVLQLSALVLGVDGARAHSVLELGRFAGQAARTRVGTYSLGMRTSCFSVLQAAGIPATRGADGPLTADADTASIGRVAAAAGVALVELRAAEGAGLEDVFRRLTSEPAAGHSDAAERGAT
ncbi:MAG TPA: hypothetical protein VEZ46_16445 [Mycobacteriales bacterium]|nr:hypothetical protein [Mycobacteriales bacterium]